MDELNAPVPLRVTDQVPDWLWAIVGIVYLCGWAIWVTLFGKRTA